MGNLQTYDEDWSKEELERDKKRSKKQKNGKFLRFVGDKDEFIARLLPPPVGKPRILETKEHFYKNGDKWVHYVCPEWAGLYTCPDCSRARKLFHTKSEPDNKAARDISAKWCYRSNAIDREDEAFGPKILEMRKTQKDKVVDLGARHGSPFITGEAGYDLLFMKDKSLGGNKMYDVAFDVDGGRKPLGEMSWLERQHDLSEYAKVLSKEELAKLTGLPIPEENTDASEMF